MLLQFQHTALISDRIQEEIYRLRDEQRRVEVIYCSPEIVSRMKDVEFVAGVDSGTFRGTPLRAKPGMGKLVRFECGVDGFTVVGMYE